ncbi:mannosyl-oligosaccharide glucosidase [Aspergillus ochraceoroseus]|uniref:Mannosyl-oligosaccharide glucosidase n=1 Tax=Aspergillus ochraceoroseus TaxID=138278 RepID=A0A0F8X0R9_9EURO|nr:mannosyl-oligosaccharide glucosidase [Aspergillus ochraceoroseus]
MSVPSERREIVIIGGGIIGCCSAYYLTRHPSFDSSRHSVTLLEASEIAGGASGKAGGLLALWAYPSNIVPLSYKLHAELAKEHNGKEIWGYRQVGCGQLVARGRPLQEKKDAGRDGNSVSLQKRSPAAMGKLKTAQMPEGLDWIESGLVRGYESMSDPGETAQVHPYLFTTSIAKLAEEKGAKITLGSVASIDYENDAVKSVTYTAKETGQSHTIPATDVVVAAGPWTTSVMPEAPISATRAHSVVIRPTRPTSAHTLFTNIEIPADFDPANPSRPTVATPEIYARPDDTVYACGEGDQTVPLPSTTADVEVDQKRCQDIINQVGAISDVLRDGEVCARQACYLPNVTAIRGGPLIGHTGTKGLYLAAGHTCWGIQNAPGTGKLISEFVFDAPLLCAVGVLSQGSTEDVSVLASEAARANNQSLLWGPYKPNLYFGVGPRIPNSLSAGLMWAKVDNFATAQQNFRHTCEQNDGMAGYGWDEYDIRKGGRETIHDAGNSLDLTIDFIKVPGGQHGGSWAARVKGVPRDDALPDQPVTIVFYSGLEGLGNLGVTTESEDPRGFEDDVKLSGYTSDLGDFTIDITTGAKTNAYPQHDHPSYEDKPLDRTFVASLSVQPEHIWQSKMILFSQMKKAVDECIGKYGAEDPPPPPQVFTINNAPGDGNVQYVQKVFAGAFEFDILFSSGSAPQPLTSETITREIESTSLSFAERFEKILSPQAPFNSPKYLEFSKSMFSNLVGGIGFFHGSDLVDRSAASAYDEEDEGFWEEAAEARARAQPVMEGPKDLFTCVPSRPFFPRGFLWDEGFHLLLVIDWDTDLALEIVKSWFNLMDENGWIAREQILGAEARSKVPAEFTVQYPHYANPPTLFLVVEAFVDKLDAQKKNSSIGIFAEDDNTESLRSAFLKHPELGEAYMRSIYPLLKTHYFWYRSTQTGDITSYDREAFSTKEAYRWRGRTVQHILTSGLDDYPRPQPPHPGELHADLISWMGMMTRTLRRIANALGETEDAEMFQNYETAIARNIDDLHWDDGAQTYCDATIDEYEESVHVCHKGYVSISPFLTGMVGPDSPRLKAMLDLIEDPEELWSDYGIRSLSKRDELYGTAENYWRGPVWMNINYLVLKNLHDTATAPGPQQERARVMYSKLRKNLVENVFREWKKSGFAWEQYNPETGNGQRIQHFTGWTSLVAKMMSMPDLPASGKKGHDEL